MTQRVEAVSVESDVAQLFVDDALVAETKEVWRSLNHLAKHERNPVLEPECPWEGYLVLQPGTVVYEEKAGIFKMWYNTQPSQKKPDARPYLCYAVSRDGVTWEKPNLGLVEHKGSTANNILLSGVLWTHCVLKDDDEDDPRRRYKLAYWSHPEDRLPGIQVAFSPDGIHWEPYQGNPVVPAGWATGDTFSVMRDRRSGQYWLYHKTPAEPIRTVSRMVSDDFVHWRESRRVLAPDAFDPPDTQFYGLSAFPYGGQYLGLLWVYHTYLQTVDVQLVSSRDGVQWNRTADRRLLIHLVPTNQYTGRSFDSKMIYPASAPVSMDGLLWIYYSGFTVPHNALSVDHDGQIGLAQARIDRMCSLDATSEGTVITRPFQLRGSQLLMNAETRSPEPGTINSSVAWKHVFDGCVNATGRIQVEIQDEYGHAIPAFEARDCTPFKGDQTAGIVRWRNGSDLSPLLNRTVRLRFMLYNARLYSWTIR